MVEKISCTSAASRDNSSGSLVLSWVRTSLFIGMTGSLAVIGPRRQLPTAHSYLLVSAKRLFPEVQIADRGLGLVSVRLVPQSNR